MIFAVDKPSGMTSHDVVNFVRKITNIKKVGHGGTLDPMASGVLVIAVGRPFTKKLGEVLKNTDKQYAATIRMDGTSNTDDADGEITNLNVANIPTIDQINKTINKFIGKIDQTPPQYSAVKISGKPAYYYARKGEAVKIKSKKVFIKQIKILNYQWPHLTIEVSSGSGVYIRSIARDMGKELNTGGYLTELTRTKVGDYDIKKAIQLSEVEKFWMNKS